MAQINIAGTLHNTEEIQGDALNSHVVAHADEILDSTQEKKQSEVNADVDTALADRYTKAETYSKSQLDNLITTPNVQYVTVATYSALPATGEADTIYRVASWDGSAVDAAKYSEYAWNGSAYQLLAVRSGSLDGVYDISANNLTEGQPTQYADLASALGTNGANVPVGVRAGGMSVKFINSTSGKYEQWRLMAASWSTTESDWQGVDETPTAGSQNLVESGGVESVTSPIRKDIDDLKGAFDITYSYNLFDKSQPLNSGYINNSGAISSNAKYKYSYAIPITAGHYYLLSGRNLSLIASSNVRCLDSTNNPLKVLAAATGEQYGTGWQLPNEAGNDRVLNGQFLAPSGAASFQFQVVTNDVGDVDEVMLIDLGTTYSANPATPVYKEFMEATAVIIKRNSLPEVLDEEIAEKIDKVFQNEVQVDVTEDSILNNSYIKGATTSLGNKGDILTLNNYKVYRFPIVGGEIYSITGLKSSSVSIGFAIFHTSGGDDNTYKIEDSFISSYGDNPAENVRVTAPLDAAYLYIQRGNTVGTVTPKCVHIFYETVQAEERIVAIGDTSELDNTIVEELESLNNETQSIAQSVNANLMLNALSAGMKLIDYSKKHTFTWSFPKTIVSIKIDDLHPSVDLAVKIAHDIGINVVLGAPASKLNKEVNGITTTADKIGNTCLDVCQYVVANGGEIAEHTELTFTDESQIYDFFIKQKEIFLNNGIILRGAAVANSFPSDALKDKLEPYLRFYYDYSNGYGKEIPYNTSGNLVRSHTYGTNGFTTPAEVLAAVDGWVAMTQKGWHTISFHAVAGEESGGYYVTEADYRTILQGLKSRADSNDLYLHIWREVYDTYGSYN